MGKINREILGWSMEISKYINEMGNHGLSSEELTDGVATMYEHLMDGNFDLVDQLLEEAEDYGPDVIEFVESLCFIMGGNESYEKWIIARADKLYEECGKIPPYGKYEYSVDCEGCISWSVRGVAWEMYPFQGGLIRNDKTKYGEWKEWETI